MRGSLTHPLVEEHHAADGEPSVDRVPRGGCDPAVRELGLGRAAFGWNRHCEERSDEAIQRTWAPCVPLDCFPGSQSPGVAMTIAVRSKCNLGRPSGGRDVWPARCCAGLSRKPTKRAPEGALLIEKR